MRVTGADRVELSGALTEFALGWMGDPDPEGAPLSFNQANHLRSRTTPDSAPVWLAGTVDLGPQVVDVESLTRVIRQVVGEQEALRVRFTTDPQPRQHLFAPEQLHIDVDHLGPADTGTVVALLNSRCHPAASPGLCFALVDTTLVCGFDHAHVDALTIDIVLRRMWELYLDPSTPAPEVSGFVERCAADADTGVDLQTAESAARLAGWRDFFTVTGGTIPGFPLPLGQIPPRTPQRTHVQALLSDEAADRIDDGLFAVLLAEFAGAVADLGGPSRLAALIPLHTRGRRDSGWHSTAGWLVTNAPVVVDAGDHVGARAALRCAIDLAQMPLPVILEQCAPQLPAGDIFMISYLDYRRLGPELPGGQHISACSTADDVQIWFSRTHRGLDIRVRHPATPSASSAVGTLLHTLTRRLVHLTDTRRHHPAA